MRIIGFQDFGALLCLAFGGKDRKHRRAGAGHACAARLAVEHDLLNSIDFQDLQRQLKVIEDGGADHEHVAAVKRLHHFVGIAGMLCQRVNLLIGFGGGNADGVGLADHDLRAVERGNLLHGAADAGAQLSAALNAKREYEGKEPLSAREFLALMREKKKMLELPDKLNNRSVNEGFSGGEKKKNEIFQMAMLEPCLSILDETDSGLDIDALRIVAEGVNRLKTPQNASIVITHYQRLLDYIVPDFVHVLADGKIVKTGDKSLALELEEHGYENI